VNPGDHTHQVAHHVASLDVQHAVPEALELVVPSRIGALAPGV
jgi:hypothetical protein